MDPAGCSGSHLDITAPPGAKQPWIGLPAPYLLTVSFQGSVWKSKCMGVETAGSRQLTAIGPVQMHH